MKNLLLIVGLAISSFAFIAAPNCGDVKIKADTQNGFLSVNVENQENVDMKINITVFDATGEKLASQKAVLGVNASDDIVFKADEGGFKNYPLTVKLKAKGRDKAMFIKVMKQVTVKK